MKKIILFILAILLFNTTAAQDAPPEMFKFQAIIFNKKGKPIKNQIVGVEVLIYQNAINGILVYSEVFNPMTSPTGIINLEIGNGSPTLGLFTDILWGSGTFFMEVKVDISGGTKYVSIGVSQLLSVPYALFSKEAISLYGPNDTDDQNEIQTLSIEGNVLRLTDGGEVTLPENTGNFVFYFADKDGDGYGYEWNVVYADVTPAGYVTNPDDCNDDDPAINPGATEIPDDGIDQDCDGIEIYLDQDADGFTSDVDCDDLDAEVYPGAVEVCDFKDNDCDGQVDNDCIIEDCVGLLAGVLQYADENCGGLTDPGCVTGSPNYDLLAFCLEFNCLLQLSGLGLPPEWDTYTYEERALWLLAECSVADEDNDGFSVVNGDCDDFDPTIYPGATEICNDGIDQDCSGADKLCNDADNDGYVDVAFEGDDCDDTNASVNPGAFEECDGLDNDCDGLVDNIGEENEENIYYIDADGDGWGSDSSIIYSCEPVEGYVFGISGDCDDGDPTVYPLAEELCDGKDNN
ncbi:MAG: putative metal-binding motif-containing protein, partial [Bacteroidia bacterium]|nr:putative metal-binding motif-containing protein [Bacteroidia bacterium]